MRCVQGGMTLLGCPGVKAANHSGDPRKPVLGEVHVPGRMWPAALGLNPPSCLRRPVCISCFQFWIPPRMTAFELPC